MRPHLFLAMTIRYVIKAFHFIVTRRLLLLCPSINATFNVVVGPTDFLPIWYIASCIMAQYSRGSVTLGTNEMCRPRIGRQDYVTLKDFTSGMRYKAKGRAERVIKITGSMTWPRPSESFPICSHWLLYGHWTQSDAETEARPTYFVVFDE